MRTTLSKIFLVQIRVIHALMMRELHTRFGRENLGYLWFIGEPGLFCAGVTIVWSAIRPSHEHYLDTTAIVITGYVPLTMWRHSIAMSVNAFKANGSLLFHRQVVPLDIIISRVFLEVFGSIIAGIIVAFFAILLGYMKVPSDFGLLYLGLFFQSLFSLGTALIISPLSERSEILEKFIGLFSYVTLPLSGAFTMVDWVPQKYRWILLCSPSVESVEMVRGGQFGYNAHAHYNIYYTTIVDLSMILIGLSLTLRVRKYISIN